MIITPGSISETAWRPFGFTCVSADGSRVDAVFKADSSQVDADPRFIVTRYNESTLYISAADGLRDVDDMLIE